MVQSAPVARRQRQFGWYARRHRARWGLAPHVPGSLCEMPRSAILDVPIEDSNMRHFFLRSARVAAASSFILILGFAPGCGDDGDGGDDIDASPQVDASPQIDAAPQIDASPVYIGLGQSCTGAGQGDCPTGFRCLNLQGSSGTWCSQECVDQNDQVCANDYAGPGVPSCLLTVDEDNDGTPDFNSCMVLCEDGPAPGDGCAGCDGTCPGTMICDQEIMDTGGMVIAYSCR